MSTARPMGMVFDIETRPSDSTLAMDPPEDFLVKGSRANFKPDTMEKHREGQARLWPAAAAKAGSLDWRRGQVLTFGAGYWTADKRLQVVVGVANEGWGMDLLDDSPREWLGLPSWVDLHLTLCGTERGLLKFWWDVVAEEEQRHQVGFYCRDFDCPWLLLRSAVNNVVPRQVWQTSRYSYNGDRVDLVDLADVLGWFGKFNATGWGLADYCAHLGTEWQPHGVGADVFECYKKRDFRTIVEHQVFDIMATMDLYEMFAGVVL